jgi:5'/3'-nucleotidase SurE
MPKDRILVKTIKHAFVSDWIHVEGSPAAAVNVGIEMLGREFDLVVSGPNCGQNAGSACLASSGTVGAALEAVSMIPGATVVALSFFYRKPIREHSSEEISDAISNAGRILVKLFQHERSHSDGFGIFNVNVPLGAPDGIPVFNVSVNREDYGSLFQLEEENPEDGSKTFVARTLKFPKDAEKGTDRWALQSGYACVSSLRDCLSSRADETTPFDKCL